MTDFNSLIVSVLGGDCRLTESQHEAALAADRRVYASLLRLRGLHPRDAMAIVIRLLAVTTDSADLPISLAQKQRENALIQSALASIPVEEALRGFSTLAALGVNNQRSSSCMRAFVFGSPELARWCVTYRRPLRRLVTHALGRSVARACITALHEGGDARQLRYVRRHVLRHGGDPALVRECFLFLFGALEHARDPQLEAYLAAKTNLDAGRGLPRKTLRGLISTYHENKASKLRTLAGTRRNKREIGEEALRRDDSAVGRLRRYLLDADPAMLPQVQGALDREAEILPRWQGRVTLVLDASASMNGFGARMYNGIAMAHAVRELLAQCCAELRVVTTGMARGEARFAPGQGATSLANALIDAAEPSSDAIVVVSDGYENAEQGDAGLVLEALRRLGMTTPVFHIVPVFTARESLEGRCPLPADDTPGAEVIVLPDTGQAGFFTTFMRIQAHLNPQQLTTMLLGSGGY